MKSFVICGYKESGKQEFARRLIERTRRKVYGFITEKFPDKAIDGLCPIYIYPAGGQPQFDKDHLIGLGGEGTHYTNTDVFDTAGVELISTDDKDGFILMAELGFLETGADQFRRKVFECLTGDIPTVVIMKQKMQYEFMRQLRAFSGIEYIELTPGNFDELLDRVTGELNKDRE